MIIYASLISCRGEFDEEKEPDGMVLSGWTQSPAVAQDDKKSTANAGSTSNASSSMEAEKTDDVETTPGRKRKLSEACEAVNPDIPSVAGSSTRNPEKLELVDDDDELVIFDNWDSVTSKKIKLQ